MFWLVETLNGRLIGSKPWNRNVGFETHEQSVLCYTDFLGEMCDEWFNKLCIGLIEAVRGRLIGPKPWDRIDINFEPKNWSSRVWVRAVWVQFVLNCALNVCLVCIGPGMAVDCGFTK